MKAYTALPYEYLEEMDCLSDAEYGRLIRALQQYSATGIEPELKGTEKLYWKRVRNQEKRQSEAYQAYAEKQRENGKKGGRPKNPEVFEENPKNPLVFSETQQKPKKPNDNDIDNINDIKENPISNEIGKKKSSRFSPPTLDEVTDYIRERGSRVDAKAFYDYFSAGGWIDAKGQPVRNWKQKIITWEKYEPAPRAESTKRKSWAELGAELDAQREREKAYDGI